MTFTASFRKAFTERSASSSSSSSASSFSSSWTSGTDSEWSNDDSYSFISLSPSRSTTSSSTNCISRSAPALSTTTPSTPPPTYTRPSCPPPYRPRRLVTIIRPSQQHEERNATARGQDLMVFAAKIQSRSLRL